MIIPGSAYLALIAVLGFAGISKLGDMSGFAGAVGGYQLVPPSAIGAVSWLVVTAELAGAVLLAAPATRRLGAVIAMALFAAFTTAMASVMRRGLHVRCGCLNARGGGDLVGAGTLARSVLLFALAALAAFASRPFTPAQPLLAALLLVLVFLVAELATLLPRAGGPA
jgi:hypothetical protein